MRDPDVLCRFRRCTRRFPCPLGEVVLNYQVRGAIPYLRSHPTIVSLLRFDENPMCACVRRYLTSPLLDEFIVLSVGATKRTIEHFAYPSSKHPLVLVKLICIHFIFAIYFFLQKMGQICICRISETKGKRLEWMAAYPGRMIAKNDGLTLKRKPSVIEASGLH